jgi:hypothetical protein
LGNVSSLVDRGTEGSQENVRRRNTLIREQLEFSSDWERAGAGGNVREEK